MYAWRQGWSFDWNGGTHGRSISSSMVATTTATTGITMITIVMMTTAPPLLPPPPPPRHPRPTALLRLPRQPGTPHSAPRHRGSRPRKHLRRVHHQERHLLVQTAPLLTGATMPLPQTNLLRDLPNGTSAP